MSNAPTPKKENVHAGHRQRLRDRYMKSGFDNFQEHEILELLLFYSIPRANTNPIAHNLINHFGSLRAVFNASYDDIRKVDMVGPASAALIRTVADTARAARLKELESSPIDCWEKLYLYATEWYLGKAPETVAVLLLNAKQNVIKIHQLAERNLVRPMSYPEAILTLCETFHASNVVLMHNHVDGIMRPSNEDIVLTRTIFEELERNGVTLMEHVIVSGLNAVPCLDTCIGKHVTAFPFQRMV